MDKIPLPGFHKKEDDAAPNPVTDFMGKTAEAVTKTADATLELSEKTVQALDPLHVFTPNPNPTRLILAKGLFDRTGSEAYPILHARSNDPFHHLQQTKSAASDELVLEDASSKKPVLVMDRTPKPRMYDIYKTSPMTEGQAVAKTTAGGVDLYLRAKVVMADEDLQVFMENESDVLYIITKAPGLMNFSSQKVIMMKGVEKPVASTSDWEDGTYMLEIMPSVDAGLMLTLAIAADDITE